MKKPAVQEAPKEEHVHKCTLPERITYLDRYGLGKTEIKFVGVDNQGLHELYVRTAMEHLVTIRETIKELDRYTRSLPGITSSRCRLAMHALILGNPAYMEAAARLFAFEQAPQWDQIEEPMEAVDRANYSGNGTPLPKPQRKYTKRDAKYWKKVGAKRRKKVDRKGKRLKRKAKR
jgi:hypothetical protein